MIKCYTDNILACILLKIYGAVGAYLPNLPILDGDSRFLTSNLCKIDKPNFFIIYNFKNLIIAPNRVG